MHKKGFFKKMFSKKQNESESIDIPIEEVDRVLTAAGHKVEHVPEEKIVVKESAPGPVLESKEKVVFKDAEPLVVDQSDVSIEETKEVSSEEGDVKEELESESVAGKPSFFHKFRAMFKKNPESEQEKEIEAEYEQAEEILETADSEPSEAKEVVMTADPSVGDVKESLRIAFNTISMLPKESYEEFRNSDDFKKYKSLVEKYNFSKV